MSMAEYVEEFNKITDSASLQYQEFSSSPQGGVLLVTNDQLEQFTPQDLQAGLERLGRIERDVLEAAAAIDPPEEVAEFHALYFALSPYTAAREALAARAGMAADWEELSATPEMAAYRAAVASDKEACINLIATTNREGTEFGDMPWVPSELTEAVGAALDCNGYPENPEDIFRPPSSP